MLKPLFATTDQLERVMTFHRERHAVLAGNIANLDTPGYQPVDLEATSEVVTGALSVTDPGHVGGSGGPAPGQLARVVTDPAAAGADGNGVSLEREMAKLQANRARYATASELVNRRLALLRYAATDGAG